MRRVRIRRKKLVPKWLWKQFGSKCGSLCKTIIKLLPKSCNCMSSGKCLRCVFGNGDDRVAMSYLIRRDDPPQYLKLMSNCFVVVPDDAPHFSPFSACKRIWPYHEIVKRAIEASTSNDPPNVICQGYRKFTFHSNTVKVLTNQAWKMVLDRVGDSIMFHLLKHTLILIRITYNTYRQVAGPVIHLFARSSMNIAPDDTRPSMSSGCQGKRKRCNGEISNSGLPEEQCIEKFEVKSRKRSRLPSCKRRKKRKRLMLQDSSTEEPSRNGAEVRPEQAMQLCRCCLVFQSLSSVSTDERINRRRMLYSELESSSSLFPKNHIFSSLKSDFDGANGLLVHIFGVQMLEKGHLSSCFHKHGLCSLGFGSSCLYHSLIRLLRDFLQRAKRCQHNSLLEKFCPLPDGDGDVGSTLQLTQRHHKRTEEIQHQFSRYRPYCLYKEVVAFVRAVCLFIVPSDLLGSSSMRNTLQRNISRFIKLRRYEEFSLEQCLHRLKLSKFPVFSLSAKFRNIGQMLLERWIFWFFDHIVVPLIQAKFYVTESEHGKLNMYYYRKSIWRKLRDEKATDMKEDQSYCLLNYETVRKRLRNRSFGYSRVRLCPKEKGARPLVNMKAASKFPFYSSKKQETFYRRFKSVNTVLQDLHVILKDLKVKEPERWGATVSSYNDIHRKFCSFLRHLKERQQTMPVVYIVVADIQKAFDTVDQDMLLSILNDIKMEDTYSLQLSSVTCFTETNSWTSNLKLIEGSGSALIHSIRPFHQKSCQRFINQEQSVTVRWERLKIILKEHLTNNVVKLGQCFYSQTVGVSQGSVLSTLLCTLYYGHIENSIIFPYLAQIDHGSQILADNVNGSAALEATTDVSSSSSPYLLLRYVDDYLFVSTSKKQASSFVSRLKRGFHKYNCNMNQDKFCMNFDFKAHKLDSKRLLVTRDGVSFMKWSGLLINCCTLEVQADYSRYLNNHMGSTLTVNSKHRRGHHLTTKLISYVRAKCLAILFDTKINSPATIRLNVYQAFVVCAMKFHCYVRKLSRWCKVDPVTCFVSIKKSLRFTYRLMALKMRRVKCASNCHHVLKVTAEEVKCLGLIAFIKVLKRKKSSHTSLLCRLRTELAARSREVARSSALKNAVHDSHSSYLWEITY